MVRYRNLQSYIKRLTILALIFTVQSSLCQTNVLESFSNLNSLTIDSLSKVSRSIIKFDRNLSKVFNETLELPYKYLENENFSVGQPTKKLIETTLHKNSNKRHFITFGPIDGPPLWRKRPLVLDIP